MQIAMFYDCNFLFRTRTEIPLTYQKYDNYSCANYSVPIITAAACRVPIELRSFLSDFTNFRCLYVNILFGFVWQTQSAIHAKMASVRNAYRTGAVPGLFIVGQFVARPGDILLPVWTRLQNCPWFRMPTVSWW